MVADREFIVTTGSAADYASAADVASAVQTALAKAATRSTRQTGRAKNAAPVASVVAEPLTHLRRTWFDTFDWRLHRANLTLERIESGRSNAGGGRLVLASRVGTVSADIVAPTNAGAAGFAPVRMAFPFDSVVPPGPLRARLEPIVEMRALSPVVAVRTAVRTIRVRNGDEKTVARVVVENAADDARHGGRGIACRVSVVACRGYDAEAFATARLVEKLPGITATETSMFAQAVSATGRTPGDYSSKLDVALTVGMPAAYAMRRIMRALLDAAQRNMPGVLADTDSEFLHDLRVAIRRGRSALKVPGAALPAAHAETAGVALKWLGDLTTPTRDLDVYLLGLDGLASEVATPGWDVAQLGPFREFPDGSPSDGAGGVGAILAYRPCASRIRCVGGRKHRREFRRRNCPRPDRAADSWVGHRVGGEGCSRQGVQASHQGRRGDRT